MSQPWDRRLIGDVCDVVNGATPKTGNAVFWDGPHQWVTPAEMGKRPTPYLEETARSLTEEGLGSCSASPVPPLSVIMSSRAPIGHLVINTVPMSFNQGCKGLVPRAGLDHKFLYYFLFSEVDHLNDLGTGATFKELSAGSLKKVVIPVPPLPEQQRIVGILDQAFEGIAKTKTNAERNLANAKELYRSEFSSILRDAKGWKEVTLPAISKNLDGKRIPITRSDRVAGEIPYYGASGIVDYVEGFIFDDDILLVSEDGANLLARSTPIAFPVQGKCWVNNHAHVLKFEDMVLQRYVEKFINHISIERFVTGAAQPKLTQASLNKIPILMPADITETANIADRLDELSELALSLQENAKTKLKHLESLQGAILHQAFSGNL